MTDTLALASEFPAATEADWRKLVEAALKGAPFDKRMIGRTADGLRIEPLLQRRPDVRALPGRAPATPWQIVQRVDHPDPASANAEALHDLENGASGLSLVFAGAAGAYGFGLDGGEAAIARALEGVYLDAVAIDLDLSTQTKSAPSHLVALLKARGIDPATTAIRFGYDPLGAMARQGGTALPWRDLNILFAQQAGKLAAAGFHSALAAADGRVVHNAGGSEAQELAFVLACAIAYLRALESHSISLDHARRMIFFRLAADADQFLTIAKFRALRKLWARVEEACGLAPAPAFIAAETAWRMMTKRDPNVNMLRATIAAFSAGIGGADAVTVLPFTLALGLPDRFARRVARNAQLVLLEESNLAKVTDPAAGSGGFEDLTEKLCVAAWTLFQEIEKAGGAYAALESGLIQSKVAATCAERRKAIATRRDPLTGTSDYPNLGEAAASVFDVEQVAATPSKLSTTFEALEPSRLAEPFEALRDRSDDKLWKSGARPKVFLANLGTPSDFTARATFAKSFFEAGGIEAVSNEGFGDTAQMADAFRASGAALACLCSSDEVYAREAVAAAKALKEAGCHLFLAGRPGDAEPQYRGAGIESFIFAGCDALATLKAAYDMMG